MNVLEADVVKAVPAPVEPRFVRRVLQRAASVSEVQARLHDRPRALAVRITGDAELRRLNSAFAGEDHATDVLSFAGEGDHLGDIAISWPAVVRQARRHRHSESSELALLVVHGLLHLLGWDHASPAERAVMTAITRDALSRARIQISARRL